MSGYLYGQRESLAMLEALRSLDAEKIERYARRHGLTLPPTGPSFWAGVHKARLSLDWMTEEEKAVSREWLRVNGFRPGPL